MATKKQKKMLVLFVVIGAVVLLGRGFLTPDPEPVVEDLTTPEEPKEDVVEEEKTTMPMITTKNVLIAPLPLKKGTVLRENALTIEAVPEDDLQGEYLLEESYSVQNLLGAILLQDVGAGAYIKRSYLHIPREDGNPLRAFMEPGMSAITVPLETFALMDGNIGPGDRVDVLVTLIAGGQGGGQSSLPSSRTLLRDVHILSIRGRSLLNSGDNATQDALTLAPDSPGALTATLEVTPYQAELLSVSSRLGQINFTLHRQAKQGMPASENNVGEVLGQDVIPYVPSVTRGGR